MRWFPALALGLACGYASACGLANVIPERAAPIETIAAATCREVGVTGVLQSSPDDPRSVWLETPDGARVDVVFPLGYTAKFEPVGSELVFKAYDGEGLLAATTTDQFHATCDAARPGTILVMRKQS